LGARFIALPKFVSHSSIHRPAHFTPEVVVARTTLAIQGRRALTWRSNSRQRIIGEDKLQEHEISAFSSP
jgi:hypothetical protein